MVTAYYTDSLTILSTSLVPGNCIRRRVPPGNSAFADLMSPVIGANIGLPASLICHFRRSAGVAAALREEARNLPRALLAAAHQRRPGVGSGYGLGDAGAAG